MSIKNITREHVLAAVRKIELEKIPLKASTIYDVVISGKRYPPKEIMRYANLEANGTKDWPNGGGEPTNEYLEEFGFEILQKVQADTAIDSIGRIIKLGSNWGRGAPSFYEMIRDREIVICADDLLYQPNDLILITKGHAIYALAKVLEYPLPVTSNSSLEKDFNQFDIEYEEWVKYASAEWYELSQVEIFKYELQKGRCFVKSSEVITRVLKIWNNRFIKKDIKKMNAQIEICVNTILYGPPGTGKTYNLNKYKEEFFTDKGIKKTGEEVLREKVEAYPFWQVVGAVLGVSDKPLSVNEIVTHAIVKARINPSNKTKPNNLAWADLQSYADDESTQLENKYRRSIKLFHKDENSKWSITVDKKEDLSNIIDQELLDIANNPVQLPFQDIANKERYNFITFHQKYSYEDFIEGIKPALKNDKSENQSGDLQFELKKGIFYMSCLDALRLAGYNSFADCYSDTPENRIIKLGNAKKNPTKQFAILIDEINRANISAVFGELITLLEDDKRIGAENEMWIELPYSNEKFCVPSNLFVIGTMNTADRSISLLDIALRRRFEFKALYPEYFEDAWWSSLLQALNEAIYEKKKNADFFIGHAFFINREESDKSTIMNNKIIPLLNEYFQNNSDSLKYILGKAGVAIQQPSIKNNYQIVAE